MNIICNNCVGGRLYDVTKQQFPNPFIWCGFDIDDYINFVNNYDSINLNDVNFSLEHRLEKERESVLCIIKDNIKVHFSHYIYSKEYNEPFIEKHTNVLYNDILEYAKNKWFLRLKRMKEYPTFMISLNDKKINNNYFSLINKICNNIKRNILLVLHKSIDLSLINIPQIIKVIQIDDKYMSVNTAIIANELKNKIFNI